MLHNVLLQAAGVIAVSFVMSMLATDNKYVCAQAGQTWRRELYDALLQAAIEVVGSLNLSYHAPRQQGEQQVLCLVRIECEVAPMFE